MNFDEIKDSWNQETTQQPTLPPFPPEKARTAVARVRRNMRQEFIFTLIGYAFTLAYVWVFGSRKPSVLLILCTVIFVAQTFYFFSRFVLFYRRTAGYDMSLRKNLRRFTYELELNMQIYRTYSICITPLVCLLWLSIMDATGWSSIFRGLACSDIHVGANGIIWMVATVLVSQIVGAFILHLNMLYQYGGHLSTLKKLVDIMDEE